MHQEIFTTTIKDSGKRQEFNTGSRRDLQAGKGRMDLLPMLSLIRLAKHFEGGANKYGDRNWEKGQPLSRYFDSAMRHAFKYILGMRDEDHLIAACWNLMCLAQTEMMINAGKLPKELDDLPKALEPEMTQTLIAMLEAAQQKKDDSNQLKLGL